MIKLKKNEELGTINKRETILVTQNATFMSLYCLKTMEPIEKVKVRSTLQFGTRFIQNDKFILFRAVGGGRAYGIYNLEDKSVKYSKARDFRLSPDIILKDKIVMFLLGKIVIWDFMENTEKVIESEFLRKYHLIGNSRMIEKNIYRLCACKLDTVKGTDTLTFQADIDLRTFEFSILPNEDYPQTKGIPYWPKHTLEGLCLETFGYYDCFLLKDYGGEVSFRINIEEFISNKKDCCKDELCNLICYTMLEPIEIGKYVLIGEESFIYVIDTQEKVYKVNFVGLGPIISLPVLYLANRNEIWLKTEQGLQIFDFEKMKPSADKKI